MRRAWATSLVVTLLLLSPARAQDLRFEAGEHLYALSELIESGDPLWNQLFLNGWPTDSAHRRLTREVCGQSADAMIAAYLGSTAGVPLSSTDYEDERLQRAQKTNPQASTAALLRMELATYKALSGADLVIPQGFDPVAVPHQRARAELARPYSARDLGSLRWKEPGQARCSLDALGFALLAEARYARIQLARRRDGQLAGKAVKLMGATPEGGFYGLVALHCAIAKLHEVRRLVVDTRLQPEAFAPKTSLAGLEDFRYFLPSGFTPLAKTPVEYELLEGDDRLKSHLFGLCAVLLGAAEVVAIADQDAAKELQHLFNDKPIEGTSTPLFEKDTQEVALDVALFALRSLRAFHVNVIQQRATSLGGPNVRGTTITPTDLGMFLIALQAFKDKVKLGGRTAERHPRRAELEEEQRKADTLLKTLGAVLRQWDADEAGFYDTYSVANNARQAQTKSLASQAFGLRGLIVTQQHMAPAGEPTPFLQAAERTLRWLDREKWDTPAQAYAEKPGPASKASAMGAVAILGALRDMALATKDGRYLTRYTQYLESLAARGLLRAPSDRAAAGVAAEVTLQ